MGSPQMEEIVEFVKYHVRSLPPEVQRALKKEAEAVVGVVGTPVVAPAQQEGTIVGKAVYKTRKSIYTFQILEPEPANGNALGDALEALKAGERLPLKFGSREEARKFCNKLNVDITGGRAKGVWKAIHLSMKDKTVYITKE